ncbi:extracellular solute-binding protein [Lichenicoccus sp.]|uniref:extracellular solute-binding protein n=1 Tax=Lichenicoccus sp. TaxID=2781899 RepID=UPI003D12CC13
MAGTHPAYADGDTCVGKVPAIHVLSEPIPSTNYMNSVRGEFEKQWQTSVSFQNFGENDRRSKSRLDASQGSGAYQVYVVDEANVAEFATNKWILPLDNSVMPKGWDWDDFLAGRRSVATFDGKPYFAPFEGGGDVMMYRKDILAAKGMQPPTNLDEYVKDVALLNDPGKGIYGTSLRGRRGSGMNVWRWTPFFRADGGQWVVDGKPAFNSKAGVRATQTYMELMKYTPPGSATNTWSEVIEGFRSGRVAMIIESDVFGPWAEDPQKSSIVGKVGYAPPPAPLPSAGFAHGLAIAAKGNPTECSKIVSGAFIAWATGRKNEMGRIKAGILSDYGRKSTLDSAEYRAKVNPEYVQALLKTAPTTSLLIWNSPNWPRFGDELGLALEGVFTGQQTDIKQTLDGTAQDLTELTSP